MALAENTLKKSVKNYLGTVCVLYLLGFHPANHDKAAPNIGLVILS